MGETTLIAAGGDAIAYALAAWLHAKTTRTGSAKTERAYRDTIRRFRWALQSLGLDLDSDPARVADVAQAWASRPWDMKRGAVSANTHNQRLAILSSFYSFARKRRILSANPIDLVERRPSRGYEGARALDPATVSEALQAIDRATLTGMRDYALLAVAFITGRRLSELVNMRWGDIAWQGGRATVTFRAKGGKVMRDTLPAPISMSLADYIAAVHGRSPSPETAVWVSLAHNRFCMPLSRQAVSDICSKRLGTTKVHSTRHTFAHGMERVGARLSDIQARLGHASAATTSRYLASLRSAENQHGGALASLLGLDE